MQDCLKIIKIVKNEKRLEIDYEAEGRWNTFLNMSEKFFLECDINIENVPDSIAVIPLLCNILPISWVFDLKIQVNYLDKQFYTCIPNLKKGYADMHPTVQMLGKIQVENIEENNYKAENAGTLFSGGVDAFNTLCKHIEEKPTLLTVWGADVKLTDEKGWEKVRLHDILIAQKYNLECSFVKSNFRTFINYKHLRCKDCEWWHDFQHGIGLLGLFAPVAYVNKYSVIYIASSFTVADKGKYKCASDPIIDNQLRFSSCTISHDGYEYNRQDKIHNICKFTEENREKGIPIRVCWESSGGQNCCECEKCYRTILGIIAEKKDPNDFGFEFTKEKRKKMMKSLPRIVKYNFRYKYIQNRFIENYGLQEIPKDLLWFREIIIKENKPKYISFYENIIKKIKQAIRKIIRLINNV